MTLDRFKAAQESSEAGFATALAELEAGRKTSHWIWYIFPQLAGLGRSSTAQSFALRNLAAAISFLRDPLLGPRLIRITHVVAAQLARGVRLTELMGGRTDALKLVSSLTLFELAAREIFPAGPGEYDSFVADCETALTAAARQGLPRCQPTLLHARNESSE